MYSDVIDLREFYETSLGLVVRRMVRRQIRLLWPDTQGQIILGLGYATPFLRPFLGEAERVIACMPAEQGVAHWPPDGRGLVALSEETELPLPDMSVDRVLLVHGLEATEQLGELMREIWRVLNGSGRLLVVVPNRRSLWARSDRTPFGHGKPYSSNQLNQMLRQHQFVPERVARALWLPPTHSRFLLSTAPVWEEVGARWFQRVAGTVMVEASKQIYQLSRGKKVRARRPVLVPVGAGQPALGVRRDGEEQPG
ncbi:MAG: methyltransferase domain-containing protein [Inquilinus limosus]|jgi:SAM-dependent methyltransferase|uniref:Methyltransferase domain-containing protein n=1 Tax=Inquilinus limosus TaxID=171674 RepID=A0A952KE91_9PROT|nr:methyltransferase domain-containing protein [Inquilinus limosus]